MFEWDDVLIIGDSFTGSRTDKNDWPQLVTCQITNSSYDTNRRPRGKGFNGCSWWSVRTRLYEELERRVPKVLILTHTEPHRIPSEDNYNLNPGSVHQVAWHEKYFGKVNGIIDTEVSIAPSEVLLAGQQYYKHLISYRYHLWAQEKWYEELDELTKDIKYVIHLHCFDPWTGKKTYEFKNGLTFNTPLWNISDDKKEWSDSHRNHFTIKNNIKLSDIILNSINDYKKELTDLQL
jgi:hypothetical protein